MLPEGSCPPFLEPLKQWHFWVELNYCHRFLLFPQQQDCCFPLYAITSLLSSAGDGTGPGDKPGRAVSLDAALSSLEEGDLRRRVQTCGDSSQNRHSLLPWVLPVVVLSVAEMFNIQIDLELSMTKDAFCKRLSLPAERAMPSTMLAIPGISFG